MINIVYSSVSLNTSKFLQLWRVMMDKREHRTFV